MAEKIKKHPIHKSIKIRLGYKEDATDQEVLEDWRKRISRVCKPCWELKYCPYGPLVEQSPLLPIDRASAIEHNKYQKNALSTGKTGKVTVVDKLERKRIKEILADNEFMLRRAAHELHRKQMIRESQNNPDPIAAFLENFCSNLPPINEYRVPFDIHSEPRVSLQELDSDVREAIESEMKKDRKRLEEALTTGVHDQTRELDPVTQAVLAREVAEFDKDTFPEVIPEIFESGSCNIFGHICPVFFAAESLTETQDMRRRGRYIAFPIKMRVVRRDNYTCQHCKVHLRDDEVEFDHIIPISKGGSSEEHNIRLTCFNCNRDKSDKVLI